MSIFVNKDMPSSYGAVTVECTSFVPALRDEHDASRPRMENGHELRA